MNLNKKLFFHLCLIVGLIGIVISPSYSQFSKNPCQKSEREQEFIRNHPEFESGIEENKRILEEDFSLNPRSSQATKVVPIVFHILHDYGSENISDAQIHDAVRILNEDFSMSNQDISGVIQDFQSITGNADFEFRLAQLDPNGNCTNGIDRIATNLTYNADESSKLNVWPRSQYLNVWVCSSIDGNAAGYTFLPATAAFMPSRDGILIIHSYIGSLGTGSPTGSRALTHEVGHWFNLEHPWGSGNTPGLSANCNDDDGVSDTPNTMGWTSCNISGNTCGSLDNVQNFMDYSYCSLMFSQGQAARMQSAINSAIASRNNLWQNSNLVATGTDGGQLLCAADFYTEYTTLCEWGPAIQFTDISYHGVSTWSWNFPNANPTSSTLSNPMVSFPLEGVYNVGLDAGNGTSTVSTTKNSYIRVLPAPGRNLPVMEDVENDPLTNEIWFIKNNDGSYTWEVTSSTSYTGGNCFKMNNAAGNSAGQIDELLSSTYDMSNLTSATVNFKSAYAQRSASTSDKLFLYVSSNCGETWAPRWSKSGGQLASASNNTGSFIPNGQGEWLDWTVTLSASFLDENTRLKFVFESDGGNYLYLDDINVDGIFNPVPILHSPVDGAQNQSSGSLLNWKSVTGVDQYEYQLDTDQNFGSAGLISGTLSYIDQNSSNSDTEFLSSGLTSGTAYYWRVRTSSNSVNSSWSDTWSFTVSGNGIGVNEISSNNTDFDIFPNPVSHYNESIQIQFQTNSDAELYISDMLGRKLAFRMIDGSKNTQLNQIPLSIQNLNPGIYIITLKTPHYTHSKPLIVK